MVQKRSFDDEVPHEASFMLRRQEQFFNQTVLFPGYDFYKGSFVKTNYSGKHEGWLPQRVVNDNEISYGVRKPPLSDRNYNCQADEDMRLLESSSMNFPSEYCYPERRCSALSHSYDSYGWLQQNPPQKVVPIGPDHQADIPAWGQQDTLVSVCESPKTAPDFASLDDTKQRLAGICILPMPDFEVSEIGKDLVGSGRSNCGCQDVGSSRCVRQHIAEAREKLRICIGQDAFLELSFHDVGEQVAATWLEEEEELFRDVVFSYPSSTCKNFWNYLSAAIPSRMKAEIVRYYYNVVVLRRRAEQNRCDPSNIDSDDDEWHASDKEVEDSAIESPEEVCPAGNSGLEEVDVFDEELTEETVDSAAGAAETFPAEWIDNADGTQDDSCTSYESVDTLTGARFKADNVDLWPGADGHNYITEPGDIKLWGAGDLSCLSREVDFLPTFCMIEEAFRDEPWDFNPDSKGFS